MGGSINTDRMDAVVRWLQANPGEHAASDIAVGIGDPSAAGGAISGSLMALSRLGSVSRRKTGSRSGVWSLNGGAPVAAVAAPEPVLVTDPWGDEVTEKDAQDVVKNALAFYFDRLMDSRGKNAKKQAKRELFIAGAFMTGRPLPSPVPVAASAASAPVVPESDDPARLALPADWTNDTLADRLGKAERKGRFTYEAVAETAGMSADFVRRFGTGKAYLTPEHAERIYAAVADRI